MNGPDRAHIRVSVPCNNARAIEPVYESVETSELWTVHALDLEVCPFTPVTTVLLSSRHRL